MSKPNYIRKGFLLKNYSFLFKEQSQINKSFYSDFALNTTGEIITTSMNLETAQQRQSFYLSKCPKVWKEIHKIRKSNYYRKNKIKQRIINMMPFDNVFFLTLTFSNDTLDKTSEATRRKYVTHYLKNACQGVVDYVANIDYGRLNEREHYHAVVKCEFIDFEKWHKFGAIKCEQVHKTNSDIAIAKYITKLTNHAVKKTNKRDVVIYMRKSS